jgi:hypothetical protein
MITFIYTPKDNKSEKLALDCSNVQKGAMTLVQA